MFGKGGEGGEGVGEGGRYGIWGSLGEVEWGKRGRRVWVKTLLERVVVRGKGWVRRGKVIVVVVGVDG